MRQAEGTQREAQCVSHLNCSAGLYCARWPHKTGGVPKGQVTVGVALGVDVGVGVCQVEALLKPY